MKKVLITGAGSYIGTSVEAYLNRTEYAGMYQVDTVDMIGEGWKGKDFSGYDTVFHVAGIAHADISRVTEEQKKLYYQVNCDLAVSTAKKAKEEGVRQFIYMSSIIVYGETTSVHKERVITKDTKPHPTSFYGDSKWKAEQGLVPLGDENFHVAILRPPMIYGDGGKGNYQTLKKIAMKVPVFPDFPNRRSMLALENLCEYVRQLVEEGKGGVFFPQDPAYVRTSEMVKMIAEENGRNVHLIKGFNWLIKLAGYLPGKAGGMVNKAFGSVIYDQVMEGKTENIGINNEANIKRKRILVVSQYFYPEQFRINDICQEWVKRGYEITVITGIPNYPQGKYYDGYGLNKRRTEIYHGIKIIRLPLVPRGNTSLMLSINYLSFIISGVIWKCFTKAKADAVFTFEVSPMTQALVGVWYAHKHSIPHYLYVTDLWPENVEYITGIHNKWFIGLITKMVKYIYRNSSKILTSSKSFCQAIEGYGISKNKIEFWPQYAEDYYRPVETGKATEIPQDGILNLTFAGNIGYAQGLDVLIRATRLLKEKNIQVRINIIGDGRYRQKLQADVARDQLQEYFNFIEKKPPEEIPNYLAQSDVLLLILAQNDVFSITLPSKTQAYLACGKPILVSADGEVQGLIKEANAGYVGNAADENKLAENIIMMNSLPEESLEEMGRCALEYSERYFNKKRLLDRMDFILKNEDYQIKEIKCQHLQKKHL